MTNGPAVWRRRSYSPVIAVAGPMMVRRQFRKDARRSVKAVKIASAAIISLVLCTVRVAARDEGVIVTLGPLGWPRWRFPIDRIRAARVEPHSALEYIGVGYRWTPTGPRIVLGVGQAIVLELADGRTFG